jgi:lysophospholipase L1-like esterase
LSISFIHFHLFNSSTFFYAGFDKSKTLKACCGGPNNSVCSDPSKYINWDGPHLTEAAYRQIAKGLVEGPFANPPLKPAPFKIA